MASTIFQNKVTVVPAGWANDVNTLVYNIFGGAQDTTQAISNLGLGQLALQDASSIAITGGSIEGVNIGASIPAVGTFNRLSVLSDPVLAADVVNKNYVDNAIAVGTGANTTFPNGSSSLPGVKFQSFSNTGLYASFGLLGVSVSGLSAGTFDTNGFNGKVGETTPNTGKFTNLTVDTITIGGGGGFLTETSTSTLTNKTIDASLNTVSNIPNSALASPSFVLGTATVSLGDTVSSINNLPIGSTTPAPGSFTTLSSSGDTTIGDASTDTLTINATTNFVGPVSFNNLTVPGNTVLGDNASDSLSVAATSTFTNPLTASNNVTLGSSAANTLNVASTSSFAAPVTLNSASVTNNATVGGSLSVTGASTLSNTVSIGGLATLAAGANITGNASITGSLSSTGSNTVGTTLNVTGLSTLSGGLSVAGNTSVTGNTSSTGSISAGTTLNAGGLATLNSGVNVTGNAAVSGNLSTTGSGSIGTTLNVSGLSTLSGGANIVGNVSVTGNVAATGDASALNISASGGLSITGSSTLTGAVTAGSILTTTGLATFNAGTNTTGNVTVVGDQSVTGNTSLTGDLTVSGLTTLNGNVVVGDALTDTLNINGNVVVANATSVNLGDNVSKQSDGSVLIGTSTPSSIAGTKLLVSGGHLVINPGFDLVSYGNSPGASGRNTAVGIDSQSSATITSNNNTSVGASSLRDLTTGLSNTMVGSNAGPRINSSFNSGLGSGALFNCTTGTDNTAIGASALQLCSTGSNNTCVGRMAGNNASSASNNTSIGNNSLGNVSTGSNNFAIGFSSGSDALIVVNTQSNQGVLGNDATTNLISKVALTVVSDIRDKTEISSVDLGLDFVNSVTPISYRFKKSRDSDIAVGRRILGFSAQELLSLQGDAEIVDSSDGNKLKMNNDDLIPVLFNAVKTLSEMVEELQNRVSNLGG